MLKIYDKAQWHIDAGENPDIVIARLKAVFQFLEKNNLLSFDGKEIIEIGVDSSVSLNEKMVTENGDAFLSKNYDEVIDLSSDEIVPELEKRFAGFIK